MPQDKLIAVYFINTGILVKHIKKVDGFSGCYRGLTPKLVGSVVSVLVTKRITEKFGFDDNDNDDDSKDDLKLTAEERQETNFHCFLNNLT